MREGEIVPEGVKEGVLVLTPVVLPLADTVPLLLRVGVVVLEAVLLTLAPIERLALGLTVVVPLSVCDELMDPVSLNVPETLALLV